MRRSHTIAKLVFRALLHVAPRDFRREYAATMWRDIADTIIEEEEFHGSLASFLFFLRACCDLVATGLRERGAMIFRDIVFAMRSLRKTPILTVVIITTLAVAIGANAAVFSVLRAVILAPLPYAEPQDLVAVYSAGKTFPQFASSQPDAQDIRAQNRVFTDVAMISSDQMTLTGIGKATVLNGFSITSPTFEVLGIRPQLGRFFTASEEKPGSGNSLIISDHLWRTTFGGAANVIGRSVTLDSRTYRVVGVAPAHLQFPLPSGGLLPADYWRVLLSDPKANGRGNHYLALIARLRHGISLAAANADVNRIAAELRRRYPQTNAKFGAAVVRSFTDEFIGGVRPLLIAAFGAVIGVVVVACANVANLLLSRSASRDRELAIRFAIGATRRRIISQILTETLLFTVFSGLIGVALAAALLRGFVALNPLGVPRLDDITIDGFVVAYTFVSVGLCALASGIIPALALSRPLLAESLKAAGRGGDASRGAQARNAFMVIEVAISVALVVTSGLIVRSFITLANTPLGVHVENVSIASFPGLNNTRYGSSDLVNAFYRDSLARVQVIPGVQSAAWAFTAPLLGADGQVNTEIEGFPRPKGQDEAILFNVVSPGFFATLDTPLRAGRGFTDQDRLKSAPVIIVDEEFAHMYFHDKAVGHWIRPNLGIGGIPPRRLIVGVVARERRSFADPYRPNLYLPLAQLPFGGGAMVVRMRPGVRADAAIAAAITARDPLLATPTLRSLQSFADDSLAPTRLSVFLLGSLGLVALFLAVAGVYGVVSFGVAQRTHEFGIRMALGARGDAIVRNVLTRAARLAGVGILVGIVLAGVTAGLVRSLLFGVGTLDPTTYAIVIILVAGAALLAALIPALRATRVDPVVALRQL